MTDQELSEAIQDHLKTVAKKTKLETKVEDKTKKAKVDPTAATALGTNQIGLVHLPGSDDEYVEVKDQLFFIYAPATIVRWPKPVTGDMKNFTVRIEDRTPATLKLLEALSEKAKLTSKRVPGFIGDFWIDDDGTLHIIRPDSADSQGKPHGIDIVLLGNPGSETGTNAPC